MIPLAFVQLTTGTVAAPDAGPSDDLVETVELPSQKVPAGQPANVLAPSLAPASTSAPADSYSLAGWGLEELHLTLGHSPVQPWYLSVPLDRVTSRTHVFARFRYSHAKWFEVDA